MEHTFNGPPAGKKASELWVEMQAMPRPHQIVDFPRKHPDTGKPIGQVALWILTSDENLAASIAAEKLVRTELKEGGSLGYEAAFGNASAIEILFRACRDVNDLTRQVFPSTKEMRRVLTTEECGVLFEAYMSLTATIGPIISHLTQAEADAWIDRLVEGGSHDPLGFFSSAGLRTLLRGAVSRLAKSPTPRSSAGSPPESPDAIDMGEESEGA